MDKGHHLLAWDRVCTSKAKGGLGLRRLGLMNKALLCKWLWHFEVEQDSIWRQMVAAKYRVMEDGDPRPVRGPHGIDPWEGIMGCFQDHSEVVRIVVGDGRRTKFWEDRWCGDQPLRQTCPSVFSMVSNP